MTTQPNNPPAFPRTGFGFYGDSHSSKYADTSPQDGMTLRDYFAAAALPPILLGKYGEQAQSNDDSAAAWAYALADAMLRARQKQP